MTKTNPPKPLLPPAPLHSLALEVYMGSPYVSVQPLAVSHILQQHLTRMQARLTKPGYHTTTQVQHVLSKGRCWYAKKGAKVALTSAGLSS
jgi:hypothetical protein